MTMVEKLVIVLVWGGLATILIASGPVRRPDAAAEVHETEISFSDSMAKRNFEAFQRFLADEAVFLKSGRELRGKEAVAAAWKPFFDGPKAPFSWRPESVAVLDSGQLGLSSGPILDPLGRRTGTYCSVWRREADGEWRIIFDLACPACDRRNR